MQKEDLKEFIFLKREVQQCDSELKLLKRAALEDSCLIRKIYPLEQRLLKLKASALKKADEIVEYIEQCPESYMRQILTLRYLKGFSWEKVAFKTGGRNKGDTIRKMAERYIQKSIKSAQAKKQEGA